MDKFDTTKVSSMLPSAGKSAPVHQYTPVHTSTPVAPFGAQVDECPVAAAHGGAPAPAHAHSSSDAPFGTQVDKYLRAPVED